ncbi:SDR family oxidoreductase, partial [Burkholderia gladioli]
MKLTENTILITGGTSGIGRALAEAFHQRGNKVIIAGRRKALLDEIAAANPGIDTIELDIGNAEQIRDVARQLIERYPSLNVLINNAGIMPFDDAAGAVDDEQAVRLVNTNLLGPVRMSGALVEHLKKQPQSYIVNNSSVLAYVPLAATALYS